VNWIAVVYGPGGATSTGLTLVTSGANGEQFALTVASTVQGQVVLSVSFASTTGVTVFGTPQVVLDRPPGVVLTGVALVPSVIQSQAGAQVSLALMGTFDGTISSSLFVSGTNPTFQSSNAAVATVDGTGRVGLVAVGTATITATYNGNLIATCAVTVLDAVPALTSTPSAAGTVGQPFGYQITASQAVQTFAATPLPVGVTLNAQTGLISGTPTTQGATATLVSVTNANGSGSKQVDITIAGPAGAPTDIGFDAAGVSEQKPIGTLVGRLTTADPNPLDTFTYQLVAGTGSTDNAKFSIAGGQLFTAAVLSRATQTTVSIRVGTTDPTSASFEKALVLAVMAPPAITRQPDPQQVFAGERALFVVDASGLEPLGYQWKKDGVDLDGANGRILEIASANPSQAGSYTVSVTNGDGTAASAAAGLTVDASSYSRWLSLVPNATGGPVYEPLGDFNGDGMANFLEFAFGVPPGALSALGARPFFSRDVTGAFFTYYAANGTEPLNYRIMKSGELAMWQEHVPAPGDVTVINHGGYSEVRVRVPWGDPKMFLRLEVGTQ